MTKKVWLGLFFILLGFGFFLQQAGIWQFSSIFASGWPIILVIIGIIQLLNRNNTSVISGLIFIAVGGLLFLNKFVEFNIFQFTWPLILVFIGLVFIFSRSALKRDRPVNTDETIESFSLFSGTEIESHSDHFLGGTVTTIFGGAEVDLREVIVPPEGAKLELTVIFGGIEIRMPENVRIDVSGMPIFGAWENKTKRHSENNEMLPVLSVDCTVIFGGLEIRD